MAKYRIIRHTRDSKITYRPQRKFLFWWLTLKSHTPVYLPVPGSKPYVAYPLASFSTAQEAEKFLTAHTAKAEKPKTVIDVVWEGHP